MAKNFALRRWFVQLNRSKSMGYYPSREKAEDVASYYRSKGYPKAKTERN